MYTEWQPSAYDSCLCSIEDVRCRKAQCVRAVAHNNECHRHATYVFCQFFLLFCVIYKESRVRRVHM